MNETMNTSPRPFTTPTALHQQKEEQQKKHLTFTGKSTSCCVCVVDMVSSTKLVSEIPLSQTSMFYSIFLNNIADVVEKNNGKIVKSIGDALLFYFDDSSDDLFFDALNCGMEIVSKRNEILEMLENESLPEISYRISADFGKVVIGYSSISAAEDIFGPVVNMSSKINPLGNSNGMVIGFDMYRMVKSLPEFQFNEIRPDSANKPRKYSVFDVKRT